MQRLRLEFRQRLRNGKRFDFPVFDDAPVQFAQKRTPVGFVPFPAFSPSRIIGTNHSRPPRVLANAIQKMPRRVMRVHARILKPDQIAQIMVAEDHPHLIAVLRPFVRFVSDVNARVAVERA